jgi:Tfp pilus assembly protein PilN
MRAVNLIPPDQRRGAGGVAGRSGGVAYVLIGGLVGVVVLATIYALAAHQASNRKSQIATVTAQASAEQVQANALQPYVQFAQLSQQREQAVVGLVNSRFDWPGAMDQIARSLPSDVTLTSLSGSIGGSGTSSTTPAPPAGAPGAAGAAGAAGLTGPGFTFVGCASSHSEVGTVLVALRRIAGVSNVSLTSATKAGGTSGAGAATPVTGGSGGSCPHVTFNGTLSYGGPGASQLASKPAAGVATPSSTPATKQPAASSQPNATSAAAHRGSALAVSDPPHHVVNSSTPQGKR